MRTEDKLTIVADAPKYDVSCASSGSRRKNSGNRRGNAAPSGICHAYTEKGLFLSSGVMRSPDDTMDRLVRTVQDRRRQGVNRYVHLTCVPFADRPNQRIFP